MFFRPQLRRQPIRDPLDVLPYRLHGSTEQHKFLIDIVSWFLWHHIQIGRRIDHHTCADGNAGGARHTVETDIPGFFAGQRQATDGPGGLAVGDNPCQLGRYSYQKRFFTFVKIALNALLLDNNNA